MNKVKKPTYVVSHEITRSIDTRSEGLDILDLQFFDHLKEIVGVGFRDGESTARQFIYEFPWPHEEQDDKLTFRARMGRMVH